MNLWHRAKRDNIALTKTQRRKGQNRIDILRRETHTSPSHKPGTPMLSLPLPKNAYTHTHEEGPNHFSRKGCPQMQPKHTEIHAEKPHRVCTGKADVHAFCPQHPQSNLLEPCQNKPGRNTHCPPFWSHAETSPPRRSQLTCRHARDTMGGCNDKSCSCQKLKPRAATQIRPKWRQGNTQRRCTIARSSALSCG
jgi:hypothetical protein